MRDPAAKQECDRRYKARDPEKWRTYRREYMRKWVADNRERARYHNLRTDLRRQGLDPDAIPPRSSVCDVCGTAPTKKALALDHDHDTKKVRGWLCSNCNTALGLADDCVERLLQLAMYLEKHKG